MSPRNFFGVVVRTAGFLACGYGVYNAIHVGWRMFVVVKFSTYPYTPTQLVLDQGPSVGWFLGGILLLKSADRIARFAYRGRRAGACENCGYDLRGSPGRCPECGAEPPAATSV